MKKLAPLMLLLFAFNLFSQDYCPVNIGNSWIYLFSGNGSIIDTDSLKRSITGDTIHQGTKFYIVTQNLKTTMYDTTYNYYLLDDGDYVYYYESLDIDESTASDGQIDIFGQHTLTDGSKWINIFEDTSDISFSGDVISDEINYTNCFSAINVTPTIQTREAVYAPDIGMLRTDTELESSNNTYAWVLKSYSINQVANSKSHITSLKSNNNLFTLQMGSILELNLSSNLKSNLNIYTLNGKKIHSKNITNQKRVYLSDTNIPNGTFIAEVINGAIREKEVIHIVK